MESTTQPTLINEDTLRFLAEAERLGFQVTVSPITGKRLDKQYLNPDGTFKNGGKGKIRDTRKDPSGERRSVRFAFTCTPSFAKELEYAAIRLADELELTLSATEENKKVSWRRDIIELMTYIGLRTLEEMDFDLSRIPDDFLPPVVVSKKQPVKGRGRLPRMA